MSFRSLLLVTLLCLVYKNEASDILKVLPQAQVILQNFLNLVEANHLNVSIVTSNSQYWSNGQVQQIADSALLLPTNNVILTQSQLTQDVGKQWLSGLQSWTSQGSGIATYRVVSIEDGDVKEQLIVSSNQDALPMSPSWENLITPDENGENGLIAEYDDYEMMYNYVIPGANNQNQTINVLAVNLNVTVKATSADMPLTQVNQIKQILPKIWMMLDDVELVAQHLQEALNAQIPLTNSFWEVLIGVDDVYIPKSNWVNISISNTGIMIFALDT